MSGVLVTFDVTGIQRAVFGSNKLRDNVGASLLVERALGAWLDEAATAAGIAEGWGDREAPGPAPDAVRLLAAGGNAQVHASDAATARRLVGAHSARLWERAPQLEVAVAVTDWRPGEAYTQADDRARCTLAERKAAHATAAVPHLPGMLARCAVTGAPASDRAAVAKEGPEWVSRGVAAARRAWDRAGPDAAVVDRAERLARAGHPALRELLARMAAGRFQWSRELEKMRGRKGEQSFLGVIHLDGNGMGAAFRALRGQGVARLREASLRVEAAGAAALAAAASAVLDGLAQDPEYPIAEVAEGRVLPLRPVLIGGDDLVLVVEASLALEAARAALAAFGASLRGGPVPGDACAGLALGRAHLPFSRLHALAEASCRRAKAARAARGGGSWLDWRFVGEDPEADGPGLRPYPLEGGRLSLDRFRREVLRPMMDPEHRAQLRGLADAIRAGRGDAFVQRAVDHGLPLGRLLPLRAELGLGTPSAFLDAIALEDFLARPLEAP